MSLFNKYINSYNGDVHKLSIDINKKYVKIFIYLEIESSFIFKL
jgi:hypothetical protein